MARQLMTPFKTGREVVEQRVSKLIIEIIQPDPTKSDIVYEIQSVAADGAVVDGRQKVVFSPLWPPEVMEAVRVIVNWSETDAEKAGIIGVGTSVADI